jgi:integrase
MSRSRSGSIFRRCTKCRWQKAVKVGAPVETCGKCRSRESLSWGYQVDLTAPGSDERRKRSSSGYATKADAERELRALMRTQDTGTYAKASSDLTVAEFLGDWLDHCQDRVHGLDMKQRTFEGYRSHVRTHIEPAAVGTVTLTRLTRKHVRAFYRDLRENGMTPATLHRVHSTLRGALAWAVEEEILTENPAKGAHKAPRKTNSATPDPWTEEETRAFLNHPEIVEDTLRVVWHVAAMTGMRRSEVLALTWSDLDAEKRSIRIRAAVVRSEDRGLMTNPPKTWESRTLTLPETVVDDLERHGTEQERIRNWVARSDWVENDLIFPNDNGGLRDPDAVTRRFVRLVKRAEMRRIRLHDLRHGHASHLIRRGATPVLVQQRLGHRNIEVTLGVYGHLWSHDEMAAVDDLAFAITGG